MRTEKRPGYSRYPGLFENGLVSSPRRLGELRNRLGVLEELIGGDHRDAIPRADLVAEGTANAAGEVDGADLKSGLVARAGDGADAVNGADDQAGFAAGAHVLVEKGEDFGEFLFGHRKRS
jgi:hypothetical protein